MCHYTGHKLVIRPPLGRPGSLRRLPAERGTSSPPPGRGGKLYWPRGCSVNLTKRRGFRGASALSPFEDGLTLLHESGLPLLVVVAGIAVVDHLLTKRE